MVESRAIWIENWKTKKNVKIFDDYWFKKKWKGGGGGGEPFPNLFWISGIFLTLQGPLDKSMVIQNIAMQYTVESKQEYYNRSNIIGPSEGTVVQKVILKCNAGLRFESWDNVQY